MLIDCKLCPADKSVAWDRDAEPAGTQQAFQPAPIKAISFVPQPQSGSFVFGERQHESAEPASSSVAMES